MKDKQLGPDKEVSIGIFKHCMKVTEMQWNTTLRNRCVFRIIHRVFHMCYLIATGTGEANVKSDVPPVARKD
jgi:hypothetical protein